MEVQQSHVEWTMSGWPSLLIHTQITTDGTTWTQTCT